MPIMSLALSSGVVILTAVILASASAAVAGAGRKPARATPQAPTQSPAKRDCTPINGRYGYYGNLDIDRFDFGQEGPPVALVVGPGQQHAVLGLPLRGQATRCGVLAAVHGISWW